MKQRDMETKLRQAIEHAAPDDVDGVLSRCEARKGIVIPMKHQNHTRKKAPMLIAASLALLLVGGALGIHYQQANTVTSVVSLDVNPSIELKLNKNEKVLAATPLNEDGRVVLEGMELKGTQVEVAMNAIVGSLLKNGYVDELANSILITVEDDDADRAIHLQQELSQEADAILAAAQVNGAILSQTLQNSTELKAKAEEYGISAGKAALIQTLVEGSGNLLAFQDLAGLSINELNLLAGSMTREQAGADAEADSETVIGGADASTDIKVTSGTIQSSGQASDSAYIGAEKAKGIALEHAGVSESEATVEKIKFDYEDGRMVYEVEFYTADTEYEYDVDALTGALVKYESEQRRTAGASGGGSSAAAGYIGEAAAKAAALKDAGVKESDTTYCNSHLEYDDGRAEHYDVEFMVGDTRYEYEIGLTDGAVLSRETERYQQTSGSGSSSTGGSTSADIGQAGAKEAALKAAGVSESQASGVKVEKDEDDGKYHYDVEFWVDTTEYDYEVDAATGAILAQDIERHGQQSASTGSTQAIGAEAALQAALKHAGVAQADAREVEVDSDLEWDDGDAPHYEVEFKAGGMEYEYEIDAASGAVLSFESDRDD